jgi:hypothetical protein
MITLDVPALLAGSRTTASVGGEFTLRRLRPPDFTVLRDFRAEIVESVGDPDVIRLMPDEERYVHECLAENNFVFGLFDGDRLLAFNSSSWPATDEDLRELYIYDLVRPRAPASAIAYVGSTMVHALLRGRGVHRFLMRVRMAVSAHVGRQHHFATVSAANFHSWRNILRMGGRVIGLYEFTDPRYGETSRLFTHQSPAPKTLGDELEWVDSDAIEAQRSLLGGGLVGVEFRTLDSTAQLGYRREIG